MKSSAAGWYAYMVLESIGLDLLRCLRDRYRLGGAEGDSILSRPLSGCSHHSAADGKCGTLLYPPGNQDK